MLARHPMHWSSDCTGRFVMRPSYDPEELEQLCEYLLTTFLRFCHGHVACPMATADLIALVAYLGGTLEWSEARRPNRVRIFVTYLAC
jgi:hypothetical protein